MRRSTRGILLVVLAFGAIAPAAHATTTVNFNQNQGLVVTGDDAANGISISPGGSGYGVIVSFGPAFTTGGCTQTSQTAVATSFDCAVGQATLVTVTGAGANDVVNVKGRAGDAVTANLGDGNDDFSALLGQAAATVDGGNGNDEFLGSPLNDTLRGGPGRDTLDGVGGADQLQGEDGDDQFNASTKVPLDAPDAEVPPQPDVMDGGPGTDEVSYNFVSEHVNVSLDGVANDGRVGENDNAINIENVVGGRASNTITGNASANKIAVSICCSNAPPGGDDVIHGGDGNDVISSGRGNDQDFGEGGADIIFGGADSDTVNGGGGVDILHDESLPLGGNVGGDLSSDPGDQGGNPGDDQLNGGPGDDRLLTGGGVDTSHGDEGADIIKAFGPTTGAIAEATFGDDNNDDIVGFGNLKVEGNDGDDTLTAIGAQTVVLGGIGNDTIRNFGASGNDTIEGNSGDDIIESGPGDDLVNGGTGADTISNLQADLNIAGADTIFGGPGPDRIDVRQRPPGTSDPSIDTVDCGRNTIRRDDDGDFLEKNVIDVNIVNCDNVTNSPFGENVNVSVPKQTLSIPRSGRVEVLVHCIRKRADRGGCKGTIRLGTLAVNGNAGSFGPRRQFQIDRGDTETLLVPISDAARAKLRNKANERARIEIVQPGKKAPHTTIRALQARKDRLGAGTVRG